LIGTRTFNGHLSLKGCCLARLSRASAIVPANPACHVNDTDPHLA
jgi:hypothetical protein